MKFRFRTPSFFVMIAVFPLSFFFVLRSLLCFRISGANREFIWQQLLPLLISNIVSVYDNAFVFRSIKTKSESLSSERLLLTGRQQEQKSGVNTWRSVNASKLSQYAISQPFLTNRKALSGPTHFILCNYSHNKCASLEQKTSS